MTGYILYGAGYMISIFLENNETASINANLPKEWVRNDLQKIADNYSIPILDLASISFETEVFDSIEKPLSGHWDNRIPELIEN